METTTTFKLDRQVDKEALYFIDWSKLRDINDLVLISNKFTKKNPT